MREKSPFGMFFLTAFVAGILTMYFGKSILLENTGLLHEDMLKQMALTFPDSNALFAFVLRKRICTVGVMVLMATTYLGIVICVAADLWYGFSAGAFLTAAIIRYGFKGIILAVAGTMPQYLLYGPVFYGLLVWCDKTCRMIYCRGSYNREQSKTPVLLERVLPIGILLAGTVLGCVLESFLNPGILKGFIRLL